MYYLIEHLKKNKNTEKEFLVEFIEILNDEKYKKIEMMFENSSSKYHNFYELYTNHSKNILKKCNFTVSFI